MDQIETQKITIKSQIKVMEQQRDIINKITLNNANLNRDLKKKDRKIKDLENKLIKLGDLKIIRETVEKIESMLAVRMYS